MNKYLSTKSSVNKPDIEVIYIYIMPHVTFVYNIGSINPYGINFSEILVLISRIFLLITSRLQAS
jgi:hypothetical protein